MTPIQICSIFWGHHIPWNLENLSRKTMIKKRLKMIKKEDKKEDKKEIDSNIISFEEDK